MTTATLQPPAASTAFESYRFVRDAVLRQLHHAPRDAFDERRAYEVAQFDYLLDATPAIVERWREHCHHLGGVQSYAYRAHHSHRAKDAVRKYNRLKKHDSKGWFVGEPDELAGFGFDVEGHRVNAETLRWNESLLALDEAGWLTELQALPRPMVVELGGGWGGFGYALRRHLPNMCHVIIDRPERLLFSGTYLRSLFPNHRWWIAEQPSVDTPSNWSQFDFVLLPDYEWEPYVVQPDLAVCLFLLEQFRGSVYESFGRWLAARECPRAYYVVRDGAPPKELTRAQRPLDSAYRITWSKRFRPSEEAPVRKSRWRSLLGMVNSKLGPFREPPPAKKKESRRHLFAHRRAAA